MTSITYCDTSSSSLANLCQTVAGGNALAVGVCKEAICSIENAADSLTGYAWAWGKGTYNFFQPELGQMKQALRQDFLVGTTQTLADAEVALTALTQEARSTVIGTALLIFIPVTLLFLIMLTLMVLSNQVDVITFIIGIALVLTISTVATLFLLAFLEQRSSILEATAMIPLKKLVQGAREIFTDVRTGLETMERKLATPEGVADWLNSIAAITQTS